jgi:hypothetical protein
LNNDGIKVNEVSEDLLNDIKEVINGAITSGLI